MQLQIDTARLSALRAFAAPAHCPHCGDLMVAPFVSEFVEGGEIRHHGNATPAAKPPQPPSRSRHIDNSLAE